MHVCGTKDTERIQLEPSRVPQISKSLNVWAVYAGTRAQNMVGCICGLCIWKQICGLWMWKQKRGSSSPRLCPTRINLSRPCFDLQAFRLSRKKSSALARSVAEKGGRPDKPCAQRSTSMTEGKVGFGHGLLHWHGFMPRRVNALTSPVHTDQDSVP